ncbi:MAG: LysM peptidoglycan-binding domain-containing protein [Planctomycetes bacterium]|nr:LysM peptidoglycan-binding domain-containing protein [Planctomycetota bacterium]
MGKFEKIVVLAVFFLVTVIFVVALNPGSDREEGYGMGAPGSVAQVEEPEAQDTAAEDLALVRRDRDPNPRRTRDEGTGPLAPTPRPSADLGAGLTLQERQRQDQEAAAAQRPDLLLDAGADVPSRTRELPAGAALVTLEGLADTWEEDIKEYTWRKGDTFVKVAERFYGDAAMVALLRRFNEGVSYTAPGDKVLVPVFDRRDEPVAAALPDAKPKPAAQLPAGSNYTVVEGDSLWVIAKKVYGQGAKWEALYEANRDQLDSPDDVSIGMVLRIP